MKSDCKDLPGLQKQSPTKATWLCQASACVLNVSWLMLWNRLPLMHHLQQMCFELSLSTTWQYCSMVLPQLLEVTHLPWEDYCCFCIFFANDCFYVKGKYKWAFCPYFCVGKHHCWVFPQRHFIQAFSNKEAKSYKLLCFSPMNPIRTPVVVVCSVFKAFNFTGSHLPFQILINYFPSSTLLW